MWAAVACAVLSLPGTAGAPSGRPTLDAPFTFRAVHSKREEHPRYTDLQTTSYLSPAMRLMTGEAWFSLPDVTVMPMPAPGVPYAITAVSYDIVDKTGRSIPLSEMYSHHWLIYDKLVGGNGYDMGCGGHDNWVSNVYGAGGEMRGIDYAYPDGYGYVTKSGKHWSANIHFIRTEDLDTSYFNGSYGEALKSCIECNHVKGFMKGPECLPGLTGCGTLACCFDGTRCPVNNRQHRTLKQYHLQYNVTWTTEVEKVKPISVYVLDGFKCEICHTVAANARPHGVTTCDDKTCVSVVEQKMHEPGTILWAYTHQHLGAINSSLEINGKYQCTSRPRHGTDPHNAPGNEQGYLVGFDMCIDTPQRGMGEAVHVSKGDVFRLTSYYSVDPDDTASHPIPGGDHVGTMNLHYFYIHPDHATPPPAPAATYSCVKGQCAPAAGGVPLKTCEDACGP